MTEDGGSTSSSVEAQNRVVGGGGGGGGDSWMARIARWPIQHVAVFFASTGTFTSGVVLGWNSFSGSVLKTKPYLDAGDANLIVSIVTVGGCIGSLLPILALFNCRGARFQLSLAYVILLFVGWLCVNKAETEYSLAIVGRILSGIGIGIFLTIVPIFISEIASPRRRDRLLFFAHTSTSCGIAVAYAFAHNAMEDLWNYNLNCALVCLPAMLCGVMMYFDPVESLAAGREDEARMALALYGVNDDTYVNMKVEELRELTKKDVKLKPRFYFKPIVLLILTICQQLSGATTVQYNAMIIVEYAGVQSFMNNDSQDDQSPEPTLTTSEQCKVCALTQIVANVLGFLLVRIFGRRATLCLSGILMAATIGMLGFTLKMSLHSVYPWMVTTILAAYYAAYGLGFGPIIWAMLADSFPFSLRLIGASIVASIGWLVSFLLNIHIVEPTDELLTALLWIFVVFSLIGAFVGVCLVRETRKKSLLDLQRQFLG